MVVDEVLFLRCAEVVDALFEHFHHLGQVLLECLHDAVQGPEEDAAVPEVVTFCNEFHCCIIVRFFLEHLHFHHIRKC